MKNNVVIYWVLFVLISGSLACDKPRSPFFQTIKGTESAFNFSTMWGQHEKPDSLTPTVPVLKGDILQAGDDPFFLMSSSYPETVDYKDSMGIAFTGKEVSQISLSHYELHRERYKNVRIRKQVWLMVDTFPSSPTVAFLKELNSQNHELMIMFMDDDTDSSINLADESILTYTDPKAVYITGSAHHIGLLQQEKKLDLLWLNDEDSIVGTLPEIPSLKSFIFLGDSLPDRFLRNNIQLENVSVTASEKSLPIQDLPNLRSLSISTTGCFDMRSAAHLKKIDRLVLHGDSIIHMEVFKDLKHLRWLRLPAETQQLQLDSLIRFNPKLEMLELGAGDHIRDLGLLKECKSLKGLTFYGDTMYQKTGFMALSNLKYLSLPPKSFKDSAYINMMKKNFPNTTIVPNSGICLGSGWILLLTPLALLLLLRRKPSLT